MNTELQERFDIRYTMHPRTQEDRSDYDVLGSAAAHGRPELSRYVWRCVVVWLRATVFDCCQAEENSSQTQ